MRDAVYDLGDASRLFNWDAGLRVVPRATITGRLWDDTLQEEAYNQLLAMAEDSVAVIDALNAEIDALQAQLAAETDPDEQARLNSEIADKQAQVAKAQVAGTELASGRVEELYKKRAYNGIQDGPVLASDGTELLPAEPGIADENIYLTQWFYLPVKVDFAEGATDEEKAAALREAALPLLVEAFQLEGENADAAYAALFTGKDIDIAADYSGLWVRNPLFGMDNYTGKWEKRVVEDDGTGDDDVIDAGAATDTGGKKRLVGPRSAGSWQVREKQGVIAVKTDGATAVPVMEDVLDGDGNPVMGADGKPQQQQAVDRRHWRAAVHLRHHQQRCVQLHRPARCLHRSQRQPLLGIVSGRAGSAEAARSQHGAERRCHRPRRHQPAAGGSG